MKAWTALQLTMLYFTNGMCLDPSVKGYAGESVIIGCKHNLPGPDKTIYFCKHDLDMPGKYCDTKMEITAGIGWQHDHRFSSNVQKGTGVIKVVLNDLTLEDTGLYWCSDLSDRASRYNSEKVQLNISKRNPEREGTCKLIGYVGHNITLPCSFDKTDKRSKTYYVCKNATDDGCITGGPSKTRIDDNATGRAIIGNLTAEDSGTYWCVVEEFSTGARFKVIELDVKPGPLPNATRNGSDTSMATSCFRPRTPTPTPSVTLSAGHAMAIPLSLSLLSMGLVVVGMGVFISRRVRRNRHIEKNSDRKTTAEESHPVADHAEHDYEEIKYADGSSSAINTIYTKAQLPNVPCTDRPYSTVQSPTSLDNDNPTCVQSPAGLDHDNDNPTYSMTQMTISTSANNNDPMCLNAHLPASPNANPLFPFDQPIRGPDDDNRVPSLDQSPMTLVANPLYSFDQVPKSPDANTRYPSDLQPPKSLDTNNSMYSTAQTPIGQLAPGDGTDGSRHVFDMLKKELSSNDDSVMSGEDEDELLTTYVIVSPVS